MGLSQSPTRETVPLNKLKDPISSVFTIANDLGWLADFYLLLFFYWSDSRHLLCIPRRGQVLQPIE
jgi:hypothetical protein